ncbi:hypothetical protein LTR36_003448 [Oleoguttula mirabilis]|uniref:Uncharacterized protein n=1 Tax=Oleoguttula mirabilis TaxID=1507867 RepID=A0AAV9JJD3_9PEZI|nr:hypothetical protein LTR36_003448 [Oleoguttula mirabilis]
MASNGRDAGPQMAQEKRKTKRGRKGTLGNDPPEYVGGLSAGLARLLATDPFAPAKAEYGSSDSKLSTGKEVRKRAASFEVESSDADSERQPPRKISKIEKVPRATPGDTAARTADAAAGSNGSLAVESTAVERQLETAVKGFGNLVSRNIELRRENVSLGQENVNHAAENARLTQENRSVVEEKRSLQQRNQKLAEESAALKEKNDGFVWEHVAQKKAIAALEKQKMSPAGNKVAGIAANAPQYL